MRRQAGFTMIELITVMVLVGVLAAVAIPRMMGENTTDAAVYGDQVASALRLAQKSAVARRRTVCVTATPANLTLLIRTQQGSGVCTAAMEGITNDLYASKDSKIVLAGAPPLMRFQPDGTITDGNDVRFGRLSLAITASGDTHRTIVLDGGSGHVD